ncbi:hypothetical protein QF026_008212 [Streptomyces aurantiacus]|nr:hypothetical protein [Streptomyces aurantiacus]
MTETQGNARETEPPEAPRGRTRWWMVAAILGVPALAVAGLLTMMAAWVLFGDF